MWWIVLVFASVVADLWTETERISDLQQWHALCGRYTVAKAYMEDSNARITVLIDPLSSMPCILEIDGSQLRIWRGAWQQVFAPVDDVFTYNPDIRALDQKETLSHIVDTQVVEVSEGKRWEKQTLIRSTINSGYMYITQFENNPGNFVGFLAFAI